MAANMVEAHKAEQARQAALETLASVLTSNYCGTHGKAMEVAERIMQKMTGTAGVLDGLAPEFQGYGSD